MSEAVGTAFLAWRPASISNLRRGPLLLPRRFILPPFDTPPPFFLILFWQISPRQSLDLPYLFALPASSQLDLLCIISYSQNTLPLVIIINARTQELPLLRSICPRSFALWSDSPNTHILHEAIEATLHPI